MPLDLVLDFALWPWQAPPSMSDPNHWKTPEGRRPTNNWEAPDPTIELDEIAEEWTPFASDRPAPERPPNPRPNYNQSWSLNQAMTRHACGLVDDEALENYIMDWQTGNGVMFADWSALPKSRREELARRDCFGKAAES